MDKGVRADYIDRHFKTTLDEANFRRSRMTEEQKAQYYASRSRHHRQEARKNLEEFRMVQEARPLKPRGVR